MRCLAGLPAQAEPAFEIVVVDQAPGARGARGRVGARPAPATSSSRGWGCPPRATSRSPSAPGDVLAVTDDDCVPDPGWIAGARGGARPRAGARGGDRPDPAACGEQPPGTYAISLRESPVARRPRGPGAAVGRRQRGELRGARRVPPRASAAGTSGSARARPAARPRTPTCSTGCCAAAGSSATSRRRSCATNGSRARRRLATRWSYAYGVGAHVRAVARAAGSRRGRALARRLRADARPPLLARAAPARPRRPAPSTPARSAALGPGRRSTGSRTRPPAAARTERARGRRHERSSTSSCARDRPRAAGRHGALRPRGAAACRRSSWSSTRATSPTPRSPRWARSAAAACPRTCSTARGLSRARNIGLRAAAAPVVVLLDDDMLVEPGWLEPLVAAVAGAPGTVATGRVLAGARPRTAPPPCPPAALVHARGAGGLPRPAAARRDARRERRRPPRRGARARRLRRAPRAPGPGSARRTTTTWATGCCAPGATIRHEPAAVVLHRAWRPPRGAAAAALGLRPRARARSTPSTCAARRLRAGAPARRRA